MDILWRSLGEWPAHRKPTSPRKSGQFRATYAATLELLEVELTKIGAKQPVIQIDIDMAELRRTGEPAARSSVRKTPGIILTYTDKTGRAVTMPLDSYHTWQQNLHALALTLVALRAVDRYGATASGEQYRGWMAIPAVTTPVMTTQAAARKLVSFAGGKDSESDVLANAATCRTVLRAAMAKTHPDKHMGDANDFKLVGELKRILQAHHGVDL